MSLVLRILDRGDAGALVVAKLDRATRSLADAAGLLERSTRRGWKFVALDLGIDTATPAGELIASVMAAVAQWERRAIGQRTKDALAAKKAQGVRLGRPTVLPTDVVERIVAAHRAGAGWSAIARQLNEDGVATAHGGVRWYPSSVRAVVLSQEEAA
jgi:DNA invertase Pin-like site-specific DNA recombinase